MKAVINQYGQIVYFNNYMPASWFHRFVLHALFCFDMVSDSCKTLIRTAKLVVRACMDNHLRYDGNIALSDNKAG